MGQGAFWTEGTWGCDIERLDARGKNGGSVDIVVKSPGQCGVDAYFACRIDREGGVDIEWVAISIGISAG